MTKESAVEFKGKFYGAVGRRKEAIARVKLFLGNGQVVINGKDYKEYFTNPLAQDLIFAPLEAMGLKDKFNMSVIASGGGKGGQLDAVCHGISRALIQYDEATKTTLRKSGFLTRDPRAKERKKYGLKRARKAPQFSKR